MIEYVETKVIKKVAVAMVCDRCHRRYDDELDMQEFLNIEHDTGYNSAFGDLQILKVDICSSCQRELFGNICRLTSIYRINR